MQQFFRRVKSSELAAGIGILAFTQLLASVVGLIRDRLLAQVFADHLGVVDAYIAAFRPSDLLFQACIMSAMGTVLVPILASYRQKGDKLELQKVLHGTTNLAAVFFGAIALLLALFFPWLAPLFTKFQGQELQLYIHFGRLALLINFLFVFGSAYGQYLITVQRYWMYGWTPVIYTLGTIAGTVFFVHSVGNYGPILGTLVGAVFYVILRFISVIRAGGMLKFVFWHKEVPGLTWMMLPRILSLGAFQAQLLFLDRLASGFTEGSVTVNAYARNFQSVLVGVVGIAIAQTVYSVLSQAIAEGNDDRFHAMLRKGTRLCLVLTILGSIALVACSPIAAWLVHLSNKLALFTVLLAVYAVSIPFESLSHLQLRAFYAMRNTMTPAIWGVIAGAAAVGSAIALSPSIGIFSVAAGYVIGEVVQTIGLYFALPKHVQKNKAISQADVLPDEAPVNP